jgi:cob(I)alamin adenosyltransferase
MFTCGPFRPLQRKRDMKKGYIQVYTGEGKGKTTAALGLALRAAGHGFRVCMVQFMKNDKKVGEMRAAELLNPWLSIYPMGPKGFVIGEPRPVDYEMARKALDFSRDVVKNKAYDVVILDEVNVAVHCGLFPLEDLLNLMDLKPDSVELILTGRDADPQVLERADLVTDMVNIKHYYRKGVVAREGIER